MWEYPRPPKIRQPLISGVDTANYPTAYDEPLSGKGIARALASGVVKRDELFIQSNFTPLSAHDKTKIPFNLDQKMEDQIKESIAQTFEDLGVDSLDAFILHAPFENEDDNVAAWKIFETYVSDKFRHLGVSNFSLAQLQKVYSNALVKPVIVQNRFQKKTVYDHEVRKFCKEHGITYQSFAMLKNNPEILESDVVARVADKLSVLNGTTKVERMQKDLQMTTKVLGDGEQLEALQPELAEWSKLLLDLAGSVKIALAEQLWP
ncbi:Aldo/keto reductase [Podospora australis]|uniref:Aldo/keto reductase n=1 Tax=Podospora australis TaxID=1536484 RepID=A0AAN6WP03_9PEZI|nr:Aldo/keto reductase [Podospora australis]